MTPLLLTALVACQNVELAQLETRQEDMADAHRALDGRVDELREGMIELGMVARPRPGEPAKGPRAELNDHQRPTTPLLGEYLFSANRTGEPTPLPALPEPERTDSPCGWKYKIEELKPISDFVLNKLDLGKASPLVLFEDDAPLRSHAFPKQFEQNCAGGFRHAGFVVLFSPTGDAPEAVSDHTYRLALSDEVPMPRGDDGRPMYWVYPGTTLTLTFDRGWDESWGDMLVDIAGRTTASEAASPLTVTVADEVFEVDGDDLVVSTEPDVQADAWSIRIESPADGPYAVLNLLTVGNPEHALVVTGPVAFKQEAGK